MRYTLGVIGGGNMAEAILKGCIKQRIMKPEEIFVADPVSARRELFSKQGMSVTDHAAQVVSESKQVMIAVKPQMFPEIAHVLKTTVDDQVVISIMAGLSSQKINQLVGRSMHVVRVMPNTPLLVGLGMSGVALGEGAEPGDEALAMKIFGAAGEVVQVEEDDLHAVTAVSGSGPAYLFYLAEAMTQAAHDFGMSDAAADLLVSQTLLGASQLLKDSDDNATTLREKVSSPGGTTQAAIERMNESDVGQKIVAAMNRCAERSRELGAC